MQNPWYSFLFVRSPITKILLGIVSLLITIAALGFQTVIEEPRMLAQTKSWEGRSIEKGAELFANNCQSCHGAEGQGGAAPPLNSKHFFEQRITDVSFPGTIQNYIRLTVAGGRPVKSRANWPSPMPTWGQRFGGPLRDDQVDHLVNFVMNWRSTAISQTVDPWDTIMVEIPVATGPLTPPQLFTAASCVGCHNIAPDDNLQKTGPDLRKLVTDAATRVPGKSAEDYVYESITNPGAFTVPGYEAMAAVMPATFKETYSEEEIRAMVAWLLDPNRSYE